MTRLEPEGRRSTADRRQFVVSVRRVAFQLAVFVLFLSWPGAEPLVAQNAGTGLDKDPTISRLLSSEENSSVLAGITVLQVIIDGKPLAEAYTGFVRGILDKSSWGGQPNRIQTVQKLVTAMGFLVSRGERFQEGPRLLVPLIGVGPDRLRREVREALVSFIDAERAPRADEDPQLARESPTFNTLGNILRTNSLPAQSQVSEIAAVLRRIDAHKLVDFLIEGMIRNRAETDDAVSAKGTRVYGLELRKMLRLDFASVQEWSDWWTAERSKPFQTVVDDSLKEFARRRVDLWRKILERFKESRDPERYLLVLSDTLEDDFTVEMRIAVFRALGEFPGWLRDTRFPTEGASVLSDEAKAALLARGAGLILDVLRGDTDSREVTRASLVALQKFNGFVLSNRALEAQVSVILSAGLASCLDSSAPNSGESDPERQADLVELLRTVGALRLTGRNIQELVKSIVESGDQPLSSQVDVAVVTEAVVALGRTLGQTKDEIVMRRFLSLYESTRDSQKKGFRDLRKACVAGLNVEVQDSLLRGEIRGLYAGILVSADDNLERIPAIVGLGILARAGDDASGEQLKNVLLNRAEFDESEVNAVLDGLAYLDSRQALTFLLDFLTAKESSPFDEQVWTRVVTILKGGGQDLSVWLLQRLEDRGYGGGLRDGASVIVRLVEDPGLKDTFSESKLNLDDRATFEDFWKYENSLIHAFEVLGQETDAMTRLKRLSDIVVKNQKIRQRHPTVDKKLQTMKARLDSKVTVKALFNKVPLPKEMLAVDVWKIFALSTQGPTDLWQGRWRDLNWVLHEIQSLTASPEAIAFCKQFAQTLDEGEKTVWKDVPADFRSLFRKELKAAIERLRESAEDAG